MGSYNSCYTTDNQGGEGSDQHPLIPIKEHPFSDAILTEMLTIFPDRPDVINFKTARRSNNEPSSFKRIDTISDCLTPQSRAILQSLGPYPFAGCQVSVSTGIEGPFYSHIEEAFYIGQLVGNTRTGWGRLLWMDGTIYEGEFVKNAQHGRGRTIHPSGDYYEGEWLDSCIGSRGRYVSFTGATYDGEWKDEKQEGYA